MVNGELELRGIPLHFPNSQSLLATLWWSLCSQFCVQSSLSQLCIHLMLTLHLDTCALSMAQDCDKMITIFHGSGASALTRNILALPCLSNKHTTGYAFRIKCPPQPGRYEVTHPAGKTLMPDRFGKKNCPSWRTWSFLARDCVGVVHATLKQAMKAAENQKQPISVTHLQHEFTVTNEMDQELQHFLVSRTEGEALEIVRGAEREPGLEHWRRVGALYDPSAARRSLDNSRQILSPPKAAKIDDLSHTIHALGKY